MTWTNEWPTEPGRYWFYGWRDSCTKRQREAPELGVVSVKRISNGVCYVMDGHFLYKAEGAEGQFKPLPDPVLPDDLTPRRA